MRTSWDLVLINWGYCWYRVSSKVRLWASYFLLSRYKMVRPTSWSRPNCFTSISHKFLFVHFFATAVAGKNEKFLLREWCKKLNSLRWKREIKSDSIARWIQFKTVPWRILFWKIKFFSFTICRCLHSTKFPLWLNSYTHSTSLMSAFLFVLFPVPFALWPHSFKDENILIHFCSGSK